MLNSLRSGAALLLALVIFTGCGGESSDDVPPVATPSVTLDRSRAALGSPIEVTYRFEVASEARFDEDYRVLVHFVDADEELMWTDDHLPPVPTTKWTPGQTVEYTRTVFVPIYPYIGSATIHVGLYSEDRRLPLAGDDTGQRAYRVATLELLPQSENVFLIFKDGWHRAEVAADNPAVEWQWTRGQAVLSFRNPKQDAQLFLSFDGRPDLIPEAQTVTLRIGDRVLATFPVTSREEQLQRIPIAAAQMGAAEMVDLIIEVDKTFVPATLPSSTSSDPRELGIRVFHAYLQVK